MRFFTPLLATAAALAIVPALVASIPAPAPAFEAEHAGSYEIDAGHSSVMFGIKHLDVANNYGRFNNMEGTFVLSEEEGKSSITLTVDAESVDTNSADRDKHLKSPDFFNVKQWPEIKFTSTKFAKKDDETFDVTGNLDFHGETKEITIELQLTGARDTGERFGYRAGFETMFEIDRTDFGMDTYGEEMLSHNIKMLVALEGVRSTK